MTTATVNFYRPYIAVTRNVATVDVSPGDYPAPEQIIDPDTGDPFLDPETGDPFLIQEGFANIDGAAVSAGVRVRRVGNDYVARPLRQNAIIETSVQYVGTMRWRRQVVEISTPELPVVEDGGSGVAAMGLGADGVGYVVKSGSGIGTTGLTVEAVGSRPSGGSGSASMELTAQAEGEAPGTSAEGSGIAALGATAEAVGSAPVGGSGVGAMGLDAEAVGSIVASGAGPAAMGLTAEGEGEAPAVTTFVYLRPGGVDTYFRPGGIDTYIRP